MNEDEKQRMRDLLRLFSNADLADFRGIMEKIQAEGKPKELTDSALELIEAEERARHYYRLVFTE